MTGPVHCGGCRGFTRDWQHECSGLTEEELPPSLRLAAALRTCGDPGCCLPEHRVSLEDLVTAFARQDHPDLRWCEPADDGDGTGPYWIYWFCEPPPPGFRFRVRPGGDTWMNEDGMLVRRIYGIEVLPDAAEEDPAAAGPPGRPGGVRPGAPAGHPAGDPAPDPPGEARPGGGSGPGGPA